MSTMVPMLAPDGTSGDIPQARVQDALKAGFKQAVSMTAPDGKSTGYIPVDRAPDAAKAGFKLMDPVENPAGEGTYAMWNTAGEKLPVPYSKVAAAQAQGYKFDTNPNKQTGATPAAQFQKDAAADPNKPSGFSVSSILHGTDPAHQAVDQAAQSVPMDTSSVGGFAKTAAQNLGAGAVRVFQPAMHPLNTAAGMVQAGGDALDPIQGGIKLGLKMGPAIAANPSGEAVAALPQAALAAAGAGEAEPAIQNASKLVTDALGPAAKALASEEGSLSASPVAELLRTKLGGPPEQMMTSAVKPGKNNLNWTPDIKTAMPYMKAAEQQLGRPIETIDDALDAASTAKQQIWQQYKQHTAQAGAMGATIDGNQIADAMMDVVGPRMKQTAPGLVDQITARADAYRRPMPVDEAEQFLSGKDGVNNDLTTYYAKNKVSQRVAEGDPQMAATVAEGQALRTALYDKLSDISGPGAQQMKQAYGAVTNVEKELLGRQIVYNRQAPVNLPEQLSYLRAAGKMATGNILGGVKDIAVQRFLSDMNDTNAQIGRAFRNVEPAPPFPLPTRPPIRGLLPGPSSTITPPPSQTNWAPPTHVMGGFPPYSPAMTPGEQTVSLMQLLRNQRPPIALPARASAIALPPPT